MILQREVCHNANGHRDDVRDMRDMRDMRVVRRHLPQYPTTRSMYTHDCVHHPTRRVSSDGDTRE